MDHQIKVRGFRVEYGEIEAVLGAHPDVAECAVSARRDGAGDSSLIAFVVPRGDAGCDEQALRSHVRGLLPEYMVPSRFVARDALP